jgi:hypothetical protein
MHPGHVTVQNNPSKVHTVFIAEGIWKREENKMFFCKTDFKIVVVI